MNALQEQTIPLYGKIVDKYHELSAKDKPQLARQSAFHKFQLLGFPTIRHEDWKYTNITRFLKDEYALETSVVAPPAQLLAKAAIPGLDCYQLILVNGIWDGKIAGSPLPKGIEIHRVKDVLNKPGFAEYFANENWGNLHFAALNAALYTDGLFIRVSANVAIDKPLHIVHLYTSDHNLLVQPRHAWIVDRNAELSIIETTQSMSGETKIWVNGLTEIFLNGDAKLDHVHLQTASGGTRLVQQTAVHQKKQSLYNNYTFTLPGADLVRNDLQARLEEDHTETHLYGLYLTAGDQLVDNHTLVDHQRPHCFSNEHYKGVLLGQSTGVFNGKVYVHRAAQKTNAFQQNNNLVISKKATIDSKPELEIFADDVKCSHGSTVGQFSEDALFYLRARGIGEAAAKALLINAFAFDVTDKLKHAAVAEFINQQISHHIPVNHAG
ncbi:Fe-S cluster assembly protein SufD [Puia sp.]|jgi:Fe-S cluster assembly protein SufD|uniref:Fe-S cluster assembly protein SufD n=1 Tax=Puia sp. TaxID=2045100 RepID=UPI002F42798A